MFTKDPRQLLQNQKKESEKNSLFENQEEAPLDQIKENVLVRTISKRINRDLDNVKKLQEMYEIIKTDFTTLLVNAMSNMKKISIWKIYIKENFKFD